MKIGFVGVGKMGQDMIMRLLKKRHHLVIFDEIKSKLKKSVSLGAIPADSI